MNYITSDLHFFHHNICGEDAFVSKRKQFKNVEVMNEYLINIHNKTVNKDDTTYHLGDLSMQGKREEVYEVLKRMNGQFILIKGNHDDSRLLNYLIKNNYKLKNGKDKFIIHEVGCIVKYNKKQYILSHYPMLVGDGRKSLRNLCGHIHEEIAPSNSSLNVGIDSLELPADTVFGAPIPFNVACDTLEMKIETALKLLDI